MLHLIITLIILAGFNYALALLCRLYERDLAHLAFTAWQSFAVILFYAIQSLF